MSSIDDLLNKISNFKCVIDGKEIVFPGILQEESGNIILNAKLPSKQYQKICIRAYIVVLWELLKMKVTLMGCHITSVSCTI